VTEPLTVVPTLDEISRNPAGAADLPPATAGALYAKTLVVLAALLPALSAPVTAPEPLEADRWLTADEAATWLGIDKKWLYRHSKTLPFARKLSHKVLRFSERGLLKYQAARAALKSR